MYEDFLNKTNYVLLNVGLMEYNKAVEVAAMDNLYEERAKCIINEMLDGIDSKSLTSYSKKYFTQEELASVLGIARQTLNSYLSKNEIKEIKLMKELLIKFNDNSDVIKFLLLKWDLDQLYKAAITNDDKVYQEAALYGISYLCHWQCSNKYKLDMRTGIYDYISNYYIKLNPLHYYFYDLFHRDKRILMTVKIEPAKRLVEDCYFMYLNDNYRTNKLLKYIKSLSLNLPLSFDSFIELLIKISNEFKSNYLYYPDLLNEIEYIVTQSSKKDIISEHGKVDFFDLRRLFKTKMDDKCYLNDVLNYYGLDSSYIYNSCKIRAYQIEALINRATIYDMKTSEENKRLLYHAGTDDFSLNKPYQSSILFNRNKKKNVKRINLHMHSTCSDGKYTVEELYKLMYDNHLDIISLTDHDTIDGLDEMKRLCDRDKEIKFIPGCEFSVVANKETSDISFLSSDITYHILAYGFDINKMKDCLENFYSNRRHDYIKYAKEIENKFLIDIPLDIDTKYQKASIVKILLNEGKAKNDGDAYRILSDLGWKTLKFDLNQLNKIIKVTGGVLIWAHPYDILYSSNKLRINSRDVANIAKELKENGVSGLEANYAGFTEAEQNSLKSIASSLDMITSYGTDFHKDGHKLFIDIDEELVDKNLIKEVK